MNILVTGNQGFVGTNLIRTLSKDHIIWGIDVILSYQKGVAQTFSWQELNSLPDVDVIIHLAGKAHDIKNEFRYQEYFDINTKLTQKIYDFFLQSSAQKFIFFSSVKAVADFVVGNTLTENVVPAPVGPYGESKVKAEEYIQSRWPQNKQVYIFRPCMIHGPGNKGNLNLLYNVVKKGIPWPLGDFENRRSFTSVDNLCYVINELLAKNIPSGIYHMADDEALSTNELIAIMCEVIGQKPHIWKVNKRLIENSAGLGTLLHLPLNIERLRKLTENYVVSNSKLKQALGISRMPVTAHEGLIKTIQSFKGIK